MPCRSAPHFGLTDQDLTRAERFSTSAAHLQQINGRLYRLTTLLATHDAELDVEREVSGLMEQTESLARDLGVYAKASIDLDERGELTRLIADLRLYRDAIAVVGSMVEIDFPSAVELIEPFDGNVRKVLAALEAMSRQAARDANDRAMVFAALAGSTLLTVGAVAAIVSVLLFGVSARLTRATVRSVRQIARATLAVARGDETLEITALKRADELGAIVQSLEAFQANVAQIAFLAHHDPLTCLPNRVLFRERVQHQLKMLDRGSRFALFFLDLDHFKEVNDTLGHPVGDDLLKQVADRTPGLRPRRRYGGAAGRRRSRDAAARHRSGRCRGAARAPHHRGDWAAL